MNVIIFPNDTNNVSVVYPNTEGTLTVEEIALKDVPKNKPFKIIPFSVLPEDHSFFDAWEADFSNPDGYGIGAQQWFINKFEAEKAKLKQIPVPERLEGQTDEEYSFEVESFNTEINRLVASFEKQIQTQKEEMSV